MKPKILTDYIQIKDQETVIIHEDYPYNNLSDLPLCKRLEVYNQDIEKIENLPNCEYVKVVSSIPKRMGKFCSITNLPKCKEVEIHTTHLKTIRDLPACEKFNIDSLLPCDTQIFSFTGKGIILRDEAGGIVYGETDVYDIKTLLSHYLEDRKALKNIDFKRTIFASLDPPLQVDLTGYDFSNLLLDNVYFYKCILDDSTFYKSILHNVRFTYCSLSQTNLSSLDLSSCQFFENNDADTIYRYSTIPFHQLPYLPEFLPDDSIRIKQWDRKYALYTWNYTYKNKITEPTIPHNGEFIILHSLDGKINEIVEGSDLNLWIRDNLSDLNSISNIDFSSTEYKPNQRKVEIKDQEIGEAIFQDLNIENCIITDCRFCKTSFLSVTIRNSRIKNTTFQDMDISDIPFHFCKIKNSIFTNTIINPETAAKLDKSNLTINVSVKINDSLIPYEEYAQCFIKKGGGNIQLFDKENLFLLTDLNPDPEPNIHHVGSELDCYRLLSNEKHKGKMKIISAVSFLPEKIQNTPSLLPFLEKIISFSNSPSNIQFNIINRLDNLLCLQLKQFLANNQSPQLSKMINAINQINQKEVIMCQAACYIQNIVTRYNVKHYLKNNPAAPATQLNKKQKK